MLGDSVPEWSVIDAVVAHDFDFEKSLDFLLRQQRDEDHGNDADAAFGVTPTATTDSPIGFPSSSDAMSIDSSPASRLFPSAK